MTFYRDILSKAAARASIEFDRLITVESLVSKSKALSVVHPRYFAIAYMHAIGRFSLPQVAKAFGLSDHTSVLHALRRAHGHDGKLVQTTRYKRNAWVEMPPLWKKELFVNMVFVDGFSEQPILSPNYETLMMVGERNLARATALLNTANGWGAEAA